LTSALVDISPLRSSRDFRRLWAGRGLSSFGSQMTLVAVIFQVWQLTGSTVWTGAVGIAQAVPLVVLGLFAGALVDRVDRRRVYLVALSGQAACSVLLAVAALSGTPPVLAVLALLLAQGCFVAVSGPAARTFVPRLLPTGQVAAGLALTRVTGQAAMLVGPAAGGLVLGWLGAAGCYLVDAASFTAALYAALRLPALPATRAPATVGSVAAVHEGLGFLVRSPMVRAALLTDLATTVLCFPISLFPLLNAERFGNDPRTLGLFLTAIAVGGIGASVLSGTFTRRRRTGLVMMLGSATWGASMLALGVVPERWAGLALLVVAGAADTVAVVSRGTIVQLATPDALRGRVGAAELVVGQAGPNVGSMAAGLLATATSAAVALASCGLLCIGAVATVAARMQLRRYDGTLIVEPQVRI
jgi:MFS family permease